MGHFLLKIINLSKSFQNGSETINVLDNINLSLLKSGLILISGPSGCGKSTLLNLIGSFLFPNEGEIIFQNENIFSFSEKKIRNYRNQKVGFVFQHYNLFLEHDVLFNLALPMLINGHSFKKATSEARKILKLYQMDQFIFQKTKYLSGGEKQRLTILRALINNPMVILADEPTGALDQENAFLTLKLLNEISKTKLVIIVSHDVELVRQFCNVHLKLFKGKLYEEKN